MSVAEKMLQNAFEAQKLTRKHFVVELDFSERSLQDLDRISDEVDFTLSGGKSAENIELLTRTWGSCFGEVLCRTCDGQWIQTPASRCGGSVQIGETVVDPHQHVHQRLTDAEYRLWECYEESS